MAAKGEMTLLSQQECYDDPDAPHLAPTYMLPRLGQLAVGAGVLIVGVGLLSSTSAKGPVATPSAVTDVMQANILAGTKHKHVVGQSPEPHLAKSKLVENKRPPVPRERHCREVTEVILAQDEADVQNLWSACSAKYSVDCREAGCCADWNMKCFEKSDGWSACNTDCKKNGTDGNWTCKELWPAQPRTFETCSKACQESSDCQVATFSADNGGVCKLSKKASTRVVWSSDRVHSTICSTSPSELEKLEAEVTAQLPWAMPAEEVKDCSWSDEDCTKTQCCNDVACSKDFSQCFGYSCYKKTEYYAGCRLHAPPKEWNGTWLGGPRELRVTGPAGAKVKLMGTSLYCFIVGTWDAPPAKPFWSPERDLVNNLKNNGLSIMQCDSHDFFDGVQTAVAEWGSFSNIDAYQVIWKEVKKRGDYAKMDWTVKVDSDAVFLPDRLKQHLDKLKVPYGARVYIENNNYRFRYMGALEVVSKPAMDIWLERSASCIRGKHEGGEDFFMRGCMDALGIEHMIDHTLLWDKYAGQDVHCTDGWAAAFHFHKSVLRWNWCYNEVVCGSRANCGSGLDVEYVMDD